MTLTTHRGFSLVEVVVAAGILGIVALAFTNFMSSIRTAHNAQLDLEARVELFQTLNSMQRMVDCKTTVDSVPNGTTIPASGLPITLKGSAAGGSTYISEFGGKKGRFSLLADIFPDSSIKIRAAAFKKDGDLPRNRLSASDSEFLSRKSNSGVWSWAYTNDLIEKNFSSLASICAGNLATAEQGGNQGGEVNISCATTLQPIVVNFAIGDYQNFTTCYVANTATGATCGVDFKKHDMDIKDPDYAKTYAPEQGQIEMQNCILQIKGCPTGQTLQWTDVSVGVFKDAYQVKKAFCG